MHETRKLEEKYSDLVIGSKSNSLPVNNVSSGSLLAKKISQAKTAQEITVSPLQKLKQKLRENHPELVERDNVSIMSGVSAVSKVSKRADLSTLRKKS